MCEIYMGKILKYLFCAVFLFFTFAVTGATDVGKFESYGSGRQFSISGKSRNSYASLSRRRSYSYNTGNITEDNGDSERNFSSRIHRKIFAFFFDIDYYICCKNNK